MEFETGDTRSYRVEISGWDSSGAFFVEKTTLHWGSEGKKEVRLESLVRQGCVVFVRLLQSSASNNFPIAYRADSVQSDESDRRTLVHLARLHPRASFKAVVASANAVSAESQVA